MWKVATKVFFEMIRIEVDERQSTEMIDYKQNSVVEITQVFIEVEVIVEGVFNQEIVMLIDTINKI